MTFDAKRFGQEMRYVVADVVRAAERKQRKYIEALEDRLEKLEARKPERGEKGEKGDTPEIDLDDAVHALANAPEIKTVLRLLASEQVNELIAETVAEYCAAHPPADGKDGEDGKDGVSPKFVQDAAGHLKAVYSADKMEDLGPVAGRDGISAEDISARYDPQRGAVIAVTTAGGTKEFDITVPLPRYVDFWGKGVTAEAGEIYTHNGSAWICTRGTKEEPGYKAQDWHLFVRKGGNG